tara:strand:+ start:1078 stop:1491 length:414 start_codon:yes stop_codon:yes gene_type:complete
MLTLHPLSAVADEWLQGGWISDGSSSLRFSISKNGVDVSEEQGRQIEEIFGKIAWIFGDHGNFEVIATEPWGNLKSTYSVVPKSDGNFKLTLISKTTDLKETYLIEKIDTGFCAIPTPKREDVGATILIECFKPVGK